MVDPLQVTSWLLVALFLVAAALFLSPDSSQGKYLADRWERLSAWMAEHGHPEDDEEDYARLELREVFREERLRADLERVRHLVATDTYMSATRQLANRIAYRQLLAETSDFAQRPALVPPGRTWAIEAADLQTTRRISGPESLDVRWR